MEQNTYQDTLADREQRVLLGMQDRFLFENTIERQQREATKAMLESIIPTISEEYSWVRSSLATEQETLVDALAEIRRHQQQTLTKTNEYPTGRESYVAFRRKIESAEKPNPTDYTAVLLIEAMMDGDIRNGTLPVLH